MASLPRQAPQRLQHLSNIASAYDICLRLEESLQQAVNMGDDVGNDLVYVRILGYLMHFVPTDIGLKHVVEEISSCADESAVLAVGRMYYHHYIWACAYPLNLLVQCHLTYNQFEPVRLPHQHLPITLLVLHLAGYKT